MEDQGDKVETMEVTESDKGKDSEPPPASKAEENEDEMEEGEISDDEEEKVEENDSAKKGSASNTKQKHSEATKSNDIEAFLKKKREDLQQKVKSQLELAGYKAKVTEGSEKDPEAVLPDTAEKKSSSKKKSSHKSESRKSHRYHDLDPEPQNVVDPQEAMISNWLSGRKKDEDESGYDPNDEFYFGARASPSTVPDVTADKDYRATNREDKDYRWAQPNPRDFGSSDDSERRRTSASPDTSRSVASNEYGDRDYRHSEGGGSHRPSKSSRDRERDRDRDKGGSSRRKRGSGDSEEEEERRFSKRSRRSPSPLRRPRSSRWEQSSRWERPSICKFFREGYCRDGDDCSYSHNAADSLRKGELCKYYQQGYCKKSQSCPYLHGEYPCKAFHKGECSKGEDCPYSHTLLNEFTQPIFDQLINDEELASTIKIPQVPTKRKVLLGAPPTMNPQQGNNMNMMGPPGPSYSDYGYNDGPPMHSNNGPHQMGNNGPRGNNGPMGNNGPPMGNNGPGPMNPGMMGNNGPMPPMPPFMDMSQGFPGPLLPPPNFPPNFMPNMPNMPNMPPMPQMPPQQPTASTDNQPQQSNNPAPNENEKEKNNEESSEPGSTYDIGEMLRKIKATVQADEEPEESPASPPPAGNQPQGSAPQNIPFHGVPKYRLILVDVPPATVNPALLTKSLGDQKLRNDPRIKKLLDSQFNAVSNMITSQKSVSGLSDSAMKQEPRAMARDPRLAKQTGASDSPKLGTESQVSIPPAPTSSSESHIQEMIKMQLQMTAAMGHQLPPPSQINPPMTGGGGVSGPSGGGMGGPMLGGSQPPSMFPPTGGGMGGPMLGGGPMLSSSSGGGGWMPQLAGPPSNFMMDMGFGTNPNTGIPPPGLIEPVGLASTPPVGGDPSRGASKDPRNRSSRWNKTSPNQSSPNYSENVPPTVPENFMAVGDSSPNSDSKPVSLREKRKDLQYESPLARPGASESSRYNEMPNVKVKRKTSPVLE